MKRKLISTVAALAMTASMSMPVFAATQPVQGAAPANTQKSEVPVVGNIGRWKDANTDINNPNSDTSGSKGEHGEVNAPNNLSDINVTVPTSMTFDVVTNTKDSNPAFASAEYTVTNNGTAPVNMSGEYNVTKNGGIDLVDTNAVVAKSGDNKIELGLSLNANGTPFILDVTDKATSTHQVSLGNGASTKLEFTSDEQGMSDIKQEALAGTFANSKKVTQGNLVLTFETAQAQAQPQS